MTKVPAKAACWSGDGNPVHLVREEYCIYIGDNDFGIYDKSGQKTSMPFGMAVNRGQSKPDRSNPMVLANMSGFQ